MRFNLPVFGVCAQSSGMGKTTLLAQLLPLLGQRGIRVSMIKQAHAGFDLDRPGKDSYRFREAGAAQVLLSSPNRWVLMTEQTSGEDDARLLDMVQHLDAGLADLVLVEGFRHAAIPKLEVFRASSGKTPLALADKDVLALATDTPIALAIPQFRLEDPLRISDFILQWLSAQQRADCRQAL